MKFKIEYNPMDSGYYLLYQRKRFLLFHYWKRISVSNTIDYVEKVRDNLLRTNTQTESK